MSRKLLGVGVLVALGALVGCKPDKACSSDSDCDSALLKCDTSVGLCYSVNAPPVDPGSCTPVCAPYDVCTAQGCTPRYSGITWVSPAAGSVLDGGTVDLVAKLELRDPAYAEFPLMLGFVVERVGAGSTGTVSLIGSDDAGTYTARWSPPQDSAEFLLSATHPSPGGPSSTPVSVRVDAVAPTLTVELLPGAGSPSGGASFVYADPGAPTARHRDETATVRVRSDSNDVAAGSLSFSVRGVGQGADFTPAAGQISDCTVAPFCKDVTVPLWVPPLAAFRGELTATASLGDAAGNVATASSTIPVTRWKWSFDGNAGPIRTSPAVGAGGTVYFGTGNSDGRVFAVKPEGTLLWSKQVGSVTSGPAVGAFSSGRELVYVGVDAQNVTPADQKVLYALQGNSTDGAILNRCGQADGAINTAVALTTTRLTGESADLETAVVLADADTFLTLRPDASSSALRCIKFPATTLTSQPGASIVASGPDVYFGAGNSLVAYRLEGAGWAAKPSYTVPTNIVPVAGLALSRNATYLVGAGARTAASVEGVIQRFQASDGLDPREFPAPRASNFIRNLVLGNEGGSEVAYFGRDVTGGGALTAMNLADMTQLRETAGAGVFPNAPVLGASGALYTASAGGQQAAVGEVTAWSASALSQTWRLADNVARIASNLPSASPSLDCARTAAGVAREEQLGTLYVPGANGFLYAFTVDSRGLDANAAWPKYQHDPRNTGNPATSLSCP